MNRTIRYVILTILFLSMIGIANVKAEGLWTGCIDSHRGDFYDFQLGINPLSPCRTNDYTDGFYNKTYVESLTSQITNLTSQINNLTLFTNQQILSSTHFTINQRVFNTVYQNNLGKPIFVSIGANCRVENVDGTCRLIAHSSPTQPFNVNDSVTQSGVYHTPSPVGIMPSLSFIVPPGYYYEVETDLGGTPILYLDQWTEWS